MHAAPPDEAIQLGDKLSSAFDLADFDVGPDHIIRKSHNPLALSLPSEVASAPGMLSQVERQLLMKLAGECYTGAGAIIDGGSFFGSSVTALAAGLRNNPSAASLASVEEKPIVAYELGHLPAPKNEKVDRRRVFGGQEYFLGDSFIPILERSVAPYADLVDLKIGDFLQQNWPRARPIEICFVDCAKTVALNQHVCAELFPSFVPHKTYLIHQDFYFDRLPWIKTTMGYYADYFQWIGQISSSSIYKCIAPIPEEICRYDPNQMGSSEDKLSLHLQCENPHLPAKRRFNLAISYCYLLASCGQPDAALLRLEEIEKEFPELVVPQGQMKVVRTQRAKRQIAASKQSPARGTRVKKPRRRKSLINRLKKFLIQFR